MHRPSSFAARRLGRPFAASLLFLLAGCSSEAPAPDVAATASAALQDCAPSRYRATVRRTDHGVPHITAPDLGSALFGQGYAVAQDQLCAVAEQMVRVRSERAKFFGRGPGDAFVDGDFALLALGVHATAEAAFPTLSPDTREAYAGFAAGYNAFLEGPEGRRPEACATAPWVRPITAVDLLAYAVEIGLVADRGIYPGIARATPPAAAPTPVLGLEAPAEPRGLEGEPGPASNAWAIGRERAAKGGGMLLANPHFPLEGELRFHEAHLTVPGSLDVYGASLLGIPGILIGFNEDVAWSYTFSSSRQSVFYKLQLKPGAPTSYLVDGAARSLLATDYTVAVKDAAVPERRTLYRSHQGPLVVLPGAPWSGATAYAYRSANADNVSLVTQSLRIARAGNVADVQGAQEERGIPWANTVAADRHGAAFYTDSSRVPNVAPSALGDFFRRLAGDPLTQAFYARGLVLLDGATATGDWLATTPGRYGVLLPLAQTPSLTRNDFTFNANDSYWLANPAAPLRGSSPLYGLTDQPLLPRTRTNAQLLAAGGSRGGAFTLDDLEKAIFGGRALAVDLLRDGIVARCRATPTFALDGVSVDLAPSCRALAAWDGAFRVESRGAVLWRELLGGLDRSALLNAGALYAEPFDATRPIATPAGLAPAAPAGDALLEALARAQTRLAAAGFPPDVALGAVQFLRRGTQRFPFPGCLAQEGCINGLAYSTNLTSSADAPSPRGPVLHAPTGLTAEGYVVNYGSSFVLAVELDADGPRARAVLTSGQSGDPRSPYYASQARVWSKERLRPVFFRGEDVRRNTVVRQDVAGARATASTP